MTNPNSDASVDMKFEIVVIPVSDVDRAKEFYEKLGWHAPERAAGKEMGQASNDVTRTLPTNLARSGRKRRWFFNSSKESSHHTALAYVGIRWHSVICGGRGSNPRPTDYQTDELDDHGSCR
jgi:catechol 2,3-dioxygenase-like lactoylglutathione lyase family enzyme